MGLIPRIVERLVDGDTPLDRLSLERAAAELLETEAPLADVSTAGVVVDAIVGLGPVERLLADPDVSDVLVNAPDEIWVERLGELRRVEGVRFGDGDEIRAAVERVIAPLGLRLDRASPAVDARLPDGSRLHAVIPPVSIDGPVLTVRRFTQAVRTLDELVDAGGIDGSGADLLRTSVRRGANILVSGGTGSGKTTLLNVLSGEIPGDQRVVTIEDAAELRLSGHVVRLEARPANAEGAGAVPLRTLVRHALRLRPDRIIVGEVRGPEALDMIQAMNTGHDGSMSTVHANGPEEALWRIESLATASAGGTAAGTLRSQLEGALDLVVHMERRGGRRRVRSVAEVRDGGIREVWAWP